MFGQRVCTCRHPHNQTSSIQILGCCYPGSYVVASRLQYDSSRSGFPCSLASVTENLWQLASEEPGLGDFVSIPLVGEAHQDVFFKADPEKVDVNVLTRLKVCPIAYRCLFNAKQG